VRVVDDRWVPGVEGREELSTLSVHLSMVAKVESDALLGRVESTTCCG
jgi:hypothetical protein